MGQTHKTKALLIVVVIILIFLSAGGILWYYYLPKAQPAEENALIRVDNLDPNQEIQSPLIITGEARGQWFFEATFPVELLDENGKLIAASYAQAKGEWMTTEFVPFEAVLSFKAPATEKGAVVLKRDNPSGLPENEDELRIPVLFKHDARTIKLYYYNADEDKDESGNVKCSRDGLAGVEREIPVTRTPIQDAVNLLLLGQITELEKDRGIGTEFPLEGFSLKGASLKDEALTLEFNDPDNKTSGGSCRAGILWFQIEATAMQFSEVSSVRFIPEYLFQP